MTVSKMRVCLNSQTPPVRFKLGYGELLDKYGDLDEPVELGKLEEGVDYEFTPGGVTAMVYPLLRRMKEEGIVSNPIWVSLGPNAPQQVILDGIRLYNIQIPVQDLGLYSNFKEGIWREIHELGKMTLDVREYEAYTRYNWLCAQAMLEMLQDIDLFYIHDFQQLQVGGLIGPSAPALFRWHIPFDLEHVSAKLRKFVRENIDAFDGIVVSTRRDLEGLIHAGYQGRAYQVYPYIDPLEWQPPPNSVLDEVRSKLRLRENEPVLLVVARMDPIKAQDVAIQAAAPFLKKGNVKLVLVGNGSFTGSAEGGLSNPKGRIWRRRLEEVVKETGTSESVLRTGYLTKDEVKAAYALSYAVLVPSHKEGFNLTTVEAWLHKKPVIVSTGAGSSELVNEGVNGFAFVRNDAEDLRRKIEQLLENQSLAEKMGDNGFDAAKVCYIDKSILSLTEIFSKTIQEFQA